MLLLCFSVAKEVMLSSMLVCFLAGFHINFSPNFHKIWWKGGTEEIIGGNLDHVWLAVWCSGKALVSINAVALHQARLVLNVHNQPPRPTQPFILLG